jgi:hypothetical protein
MRISNVKMILSLVRRELLGIMKIIPRKKKPPKERRWRRSLRPAQKLRLLTVQSLLFRLRKGFRCHKIFFQKLQ